MKFAAIHTIRRGAIAMLVMSIALLGCIGPQTPTPTGIAISTEQPTVQSSPSATSDVSPTAENTTVATSTEVSAEESPTPATEDTPIATAATGEPVEVTVPTATRIPTRAPRLTSPLATPPVPLETAFGAEMDQINADLGLPRVKAAGTRWMRRAGIPWRLIEPEEGERNWSAIAGLETEFKTASDQGFKTIVVVRETPAWAQAVEGYGCSPVKQDKLKALGTFMHDLVARYSAPPYNVRYWEIWNEPDIDYHLVTTDSLWGCWGDATDAYYGGGYYAEMLKAIYPQIKFASPESQVLVGGLLLDCDPRNPPAGKDCKPSKFLEGILRNGGGNYFDGVAFHAYDYYDNPKKGEYSHAGWNSYSTTTGPVVGVKAEFIRGVLSQYGWQNKFLMNTEMALICGNGTEPRCQAKEFQDTKAAYVVEAYVAALSEGLRAGVWYTLLGWRGSGLLDGQRQPTPAYWAYRNAAQEFAGVLDVQEQSLGAGIKAFELRRSTGKLWVIWAADAAEHTISLPSTPQSVTDISGQAQPGGESITVGPMPLYVTW